MRIRPTRAPSIVWWLYNCATPTERHVSPAEGQRQVTAELHAMASDKPAGIGLNEAIGWHLPPLPGYDLVRDTSTPSRANVAAYVRVGLLRNHRWVDHHQTWRKTRHAGIHPARSTLVLDLVGTEVIVAHNPPRFTDNTLVAQRELVYRVARIMAPTRRPEFKDLPGPRQSAELARPRLVVWDANQPVTAGLDVFGPAYLAHLVGGQVFGRGIDCAVGRNVRCRSVRYLTSLRGVRFRSDHKHAVRFVFTAERKAA